MSNAPYNEIVPTFWVHLGDEDEVTVEDTASYRKNFTGDIGVQYSETITGQPWVRIVARMKYFSNPLNRKERFGAYSEEMLLDLYPKEDILGVSEREIAIYTMCHNAPYMGVKVLKEYANELICWGLDVNDGFKKKMENLCPHFCEVIDRTKKAWDEKQAKSRKDTEETGDLKHVI